MGASVVFASFFRFPSFTPPSVSLPQGEGGLKHQSLEREELREEVDQDSPAIGLHREIMRETQDLFVQETGALAVSCLAVKGFSRAVSSVFGLTAIGLTFEKLPLVLQAVYRARQRGTSAMGEVGHILHADLWHDLGYSVFNPFLLSALSGTTPEFLQGQQWLANGLSFTLAVPFAVLMRRGASRVFSGK